MIRPATIDEIKFLNELIVQSARGLSQEDYTKEEIEDAITYVFGIDTELIEDQTYYVIEKDGVYMACGGWSKRRTLFGGNQCKTRESGYLDPFKDPAKIRAFFVHPNHARKGLARTLLEYCEQQARLEGFSKIEMMSTLPGVKFYQTCGYEFGAEENYALPNGNFIKFVKMSKSL